MKKAAFFTLAAAAALLAGSSAAKAAIASPAAVTPLDGFSFDIVGSNSTSGVGFVLGPVETALFGLTVTYNGAGVDGQNYTVTSSETTSGSKVTDTITVSTPVDFINESTYNGTTITALSLAIGSSNTLDFSSPLSNITTTGSGLYSTNTTLTFTPSTTLSNNSESLSATEGINSGTTAITGYDVRSFTYIITYAVPDPSTYAFAVIGALALGTVFLRRNRRQAAL